MVIPANWKFYLKHLSNMGNQWRVHVERYINWVRMDRLIATMRRLEMFISWRIERSLHILFLLFIAQPPDWARKSPTPDAIPKPSRPGRYQLFPIGSCLPARKEPISTRDSAGLSWGTAWPAPLTVAIVNPSYSTNLPATYIWTFPASSWEN